MNTNLNNPPSFSIDCNLLDDVPRVYRAVNNKTRLKMLQIIHVNGKITVTELYGKMGLEQSVASKNLAILRRPGFVLSERQGRNIFYSVNYSALEIIQSMSEKILSPSLNGNGRH